MTVGPTLLALCLASTSPPSGEAQKRASPFLFDIYTSLRYSALDHAPVTSLSVDDDGLWDIDALFSTGDLRHFPSGLLGLRLELEVARGLAIRLQTDTGLLAPGASLLSPIDEAVASDGQSIGQNAASLAWVRELALRFDRKGWSLDIGRRYSVLAEGLIHENYSTGLSVTYQKQGWRAQTVALLWGNSLNELGTLSPIAWLELSRELSFFEEVSIFGAVFVDRREALRETLRSETAEGLLSATGAQLAQQLGLCGLYQQEDESRGTLGFVGASTRLLPARGLSVRASAALSFGQSEMRYEERDPELCGLSITPTNAYWRNNEIRSRQHLAGAALLRLNQGLGTHFGLGLTAFALSGDNPSVQSHFGAFVGTSPFWNYTGLFFNGGIQQNLYPGSTQAAGVNGHGVVGGGPSVEFSIEGLLAELRTAALWAMTPSPLSNSNGRFYGFETDLSIEWQATPWLRLSSEVDVLALGNFFSGADLAVRAVGQVDVHWSL